MKKIYKVLAMLLVAAMLLAGCGAASEKTTTASYNSDAMYQEDGGFEPAAEAPAAMEDSATGVNTADMSSQLEMFPQGDGKKIIYTSYLELETLNFDESYATIAAAIDAAGGYVSNSNIYGGETYGSDYNARRANMTVRIPADKYSDFLAKGDTFGNVTSLENSAQDITSQYIDVEARLSSLKTQETRLLELLKQAGTLSEMLEIEKYLSDVRYEIESYTSTMKSYENQLSYCTVNIGLSEVRNISVSSPDFGSRLVEALKDSARTVLEFFKGLVICIIYALPFLAIGVAIFFLVRAIIRRNRRKAIERATLSGALPEMPESAMKPNSDKKE